MIFGFDRETDENSLREFLQQFSKEELLTQLIPRMTDEEINAIVDTLMAVMRAHFSEQEYHALFLDDPDHHH
ncbi:hypothetical protein, partial [Desulfogranum japonicum]|uniref:hypothetical protein n=1 Tax=Desulfogranum japonicum TaxID=231447 RepID=UPI00041DEE38